ncbi:hypothetical protein ISS30_01690 [bacterium]|nr:hypothetical protein [bacterium]
MSWTDSATIKKHLMQSDVAVTTVENEEHTLWGTDSEQLSSAVITENSEEVKTIDLGTPYSDGANVLTAYNWSSLDYDDLVPGSIVIASDTHRSTVYTEGVDYVVDYENGRIRRAAGSSIASGATVYVWYLYYTVHVRDTDYTINYSSGTISRITEGSIADGGIVYVDYTTTASSVPDALISEAITEAEDKILARLSSGYNASSTDQGLKTGAAELTIAIITNAKAMDIMNRSHSSASDDLARQWREMSLRYEKQAWKTLSRFLAKPAMRSAKTKVNMDLQN